MTLGKNVGPGIVPRENLLLTKKNTKDQNVKTHLWGKYSVD